MQWALKAVKWIGDELPPVVDVEEDELWEMRVRDFLKEFEAVGADGDDLFFPVHWHELVGRDRAWALAHPLWVADWREVAAPRLPTPWREWAFWQTTSKGQVPGYAGNVDLDLFNGTEAELRERYQTNGRKGNMTEDCQHGCRPLPTYFAG